VSFKVWDSTYKYSIKISCTYDMVLLNNMESYLTYLLAMFSLKDGG